MSEPKSSIHFEYHKKVAVGYFYHNSREKKTANSIFSMEHNYCNLNATEATKKFFEELNKRIEKYTKKTGKKLHKNAIKHISAIVNVKSSTTPKDIQKLVEFLEDTLGVKVVQIAGHQDEGYIDPVTGEKKRNKHYHLEMVGLDKNGMSVRRKLNKKMLIYIQDKTAKILQMERGINYTKERKKRPKRLDTYQYKRAMELKEEEKKENILLENLINFQEEQLEEIKQQKQNLKFKNIKLEITVKQLKEKIAQLRKQMIEANKTLEEQEKIFTQEDYKYLSTLKKATNSQSLEEVYYKFVDFSQKVNKKIKELNEKNKILEKENKELEEKLKEKNKEIEELNKQLEEAQKKVEELQKTTQELETIVKKQEKELKEIKQKEEDYIPIYPKFKR